MNNLYDNSIPILAINNMKLDIDPKLMLLRKGYNNTQHTNWKFALFRNLLFSIKLKSFSSQNRSEAINAVITGSLFIWITTTLGISLTLLSDSLLKYSIVIPILQIIYSVFYICKCMINLEDDRFHYRLYQILRKQEYEILNRLVINQDFTFEGLSSWLRFQIESVSQSPNPNINVNTILNQQITITEQQATITTQIKKINDLEKSSDDLEILYDKLSLSHDSVADLLKKSINILVKLAQEKKFNMELLNLNSDYSLYHIRRNKLYLIREFGCSELEYEIDPHDIKYGNFSLVQAYKTQKLSTSSSDIKGKTTVSSLIYLNKDLTFIYCFHFDSSNDILKSVVQFQETYALIKAIIIHLLEKGLLFENTLEGEIYL